VKAANEFKQFLLRGNVVDLAVAVVIGAAFGSVVGALVKDLITPLIAAVFGEPDFAALHFTVNGSTFLYGDFINAVFTFVTVSLVVFFLVVKPVNLLISRSRREPTPDPTTRKCPECLSEIPVDARRCAYCTSEVGPSAAAIAGDGAPLA
jgi:large conductance mechanosensitive channel